MKRRNAYEKWRDKKYPKETQRLIDGFAGADGTADETGRAFRAGVPGGLESLRPALADVRGKPLRNGGERMTLTIKDKPNGDIKLLVAGQFYFEWRPNAKEVFVHSNDGSLVYSNKVASVSVELSGIYVYEREEKE